MPTSLSAEDEDDLPLSDVKVDVIKLSESISASEAAILSATYSMTSYNACKI